MVNRDELGLRRPAPRPIRSVPEYLEQQRRVAALSRLTRLVEHELPKLASIGDLLEHVALGQFHDQRLGPA